MRDCWTSYDELTERHCAPARREKARSAFTGKYRRLRPRFTVHRSWLFGSVYVESSSWSDYYRMLPRVAAVYKCADNTRRTSAARPRAELDGRAL